MTSYKLCLTFLAVTYVSVSAHSFYDSADQWRSRRATEEKKEATVAASPEVSDNPVIEVGYRFGEEFFLPEASKMIQETAEYRKKADGCERIVKNSMVCMVCKDPKTNAKYEQCSYVSDPNEKSYSYPKLDATFGNPEVTKQPTPAEQQSAKSKEDSYQSEASGETSKSTEPSGVGSESYEISKPEASSSYSYNGDSSTPSRVSETSHEDPASQEHRAESSDCREVQKESETCTICKNPKTGGDLERCTSRYEPANQSYSYGKSEKFSYPQYQESKPNYKPYADENKSGSSEDPAESKNCHQVQEDSKTCTICKTASGADTKTCTSTYQPNDKVYSYGKSQKYIYPDSQEDKAPYKPYTDDGKSAEASGGDTYKSSPSEYPSRYSSSASDEIYRKYHVDEPEELRGSGYGGGKDNSAKLYGESEYGAPAAAPAAAKQSNENNADCHDVQKDSMTCTICKDPKTGGNSEKCSFAYQPNNKFYKFSKSNSFGYPGSPKANDNGGSEEKTAAASTAQVRGTENKPNAGIDASACKQIHKDTMTCTVCKDPKTGASSEQCAYSSDPKEKYFSYRNSKSFGAPRQDDKGSDESGQQESRQAPQNVTADTGKSVETGETKNTSETSTTSPCRQMKKDTMTCTICKDPKTGEISEKCEYGYKPKEKLFTYSMSKSFGTPRKDREESEKASSESEQQESQVSQKATEQQDQTPAANRPRGFSKPDWSFR